MSPATELQESVHSVFAGAAAPVVESDGRGRSVKRTLRNTLAVAETFFTGRTSGSGEGGAGMPGGRDVDTHGH